MDSPRRMNMKTMIISIIVLALLGATGCSTQRQGESEGDDTPQEVADMTAEAWEWADSVCAHMTLEEQLSQLVMPAVMSSTDQKTMDHLKWYAEDLKVGGILLLKGTAESAAEIADTLEAVRDRLHYPAGTFLAVDAETGLGMRFSDAPTFPWVSDVDKEVDEQDFFDYGQEVGREARLTGINMILGPVVDVDRSEINKPGVMNRRSLGSDQLRVARLSLAYARGVESMGVASVIKHFPGHGPTSTDTHEGLATITTPRDELYAIDLIPFRTAVQNGLSSIMVGHIWAQELDSVKRPASFSPVIINGLLRDEMGFNGLVLVDAVGMGGAKGYNSADAIIAGADIIIAPTDTKHELSILQQAVIDGLLTEEQVSAAVRRILFYKYLRFVNTGHRIDYAKTSGPEIEERLHSEAPPIIDKLKNR